MGNLEIAVQRVRNSFEESLKQHIFPEIYTEYVNKFIINLEELSKLSSQEAHVKTLLKEKKEHLEITPTFYSNSFKRYTNESLNEKIHENNFKLLNGFDKNANYLFEDVRLIVYSKENKRISSKIIGIVSKDVSTFESNSALKYLNNLKNPSKREILGYQI